MCAANFGKINRCSFPNFWTTQRVISVYANPIPMRKMHIWRVGLLAFPDSYQHGVSPLNKQKMLSTAIASNLCIAMLVMAGCSKHPAHHLKNAEAPVSTDAAPATSSAQPQQPQAPAYTPPTAEQLYQMVAPIALFPDKLVAIVLAGATYPDQITAADNLLTGNPNLKGGLLQVAVNPKPWDGSVKSLTTFPSVLDQMAQNIPWTTALGEAYVNDPTDVLNAIQVMRQRAAAHGSLGNSAQQKIRTQAVQPVVVQEKIDVSDSAPRDSYPPVYAGPAVVPAPRQVIEIEPAQPDVVYVPSYNPQVVYGVAVPVYPSYAYVRHYDTGVVVAGGAISFGVGVAVGALIDAHYEGGGWASWGMSWGSGGGGGAYVGGGGWQRPGVVYNNQAYVSRSSTVINHYTTGNVINHYSTTQNNHYTNIQNNQSYNNSHNTINNTTNNTTNEINNSHNQVVQNHNVTNNLDNRQFNSHNVTADRAVAAAATANTQKAGHPVAVADEARPARAHGAQSTDTPSSTAAGKHAAPQAEAPRSLSREESADRAAKPAAHATSKQSHQAAHPAPKQDPAKSHPKPKTASAPEHHADAPKLAEHKKQAPEKKPAPEKKHAPEEKKA